jgi:imidazoleglycerol phosphate dehydratase HisB
VGGIVAAVLDGGGIAVVGVDACEHTAVLGHHALDVDVALALGRALFKLLVNQLGMHGGEEGELTFPHER